MLQQIAMPPLCDFRISQRYANSLHPSPRATPEATTPSKRLPQSFFARAAEQVPPEQAVCSTWLYVHPTSLSHSPSHSSHLNPSEAPPHSLSLPLHPTPAAPTILLNIQHQQVRDSISEPYKIESMNDWNASRVIGGQQDPSKPLP